ncbi:MAG: DUF4276 family protein [Thermodesulfobacteriota bacterium]
MRIAIMVEGDTELAFKRHLTDYLKQHLQGRMPRLDFVPYHGRIPKGATLKRNVENLLLVGRSQADLVIALTDVYTGTRPPDFTDAADAKNKMRQWVGNEPRFRPHAAQHDFEAWLLPYWPTIQRLAGHNRNAPGGDPENVNHTNPPSRRIQEIFEVGQRRDSYNKPRDANHILSKNDLSVAILRCPELRALVNTIFQACGGAVIP